MMRRIGIFGFVLQLVFWAYPWRGALDWLAPAVHAQDEPALIISHGQGAQSFMVNLALAPPTPLPQSSCVSQAPAGTHGITVCWTASVSTTVTGYNVYVGTSTGGPYTKENAALVTGTSFFYPTPNLGGVGQFIVVRSFDGTAESANSAEISATAKGNPLPPTGVQAVSV